MLRLTFPAVLTMNVWFSEFERVQRWSYIINSIVVPEAPDVIGFQECTTGNSFTS